MISCSLLGGEEAKNVRDNPENHQSRAPMITHRNCDPGDTFGLPVEYPCRTFLFQLD
jgi:hypothetical protein